LLQSCKAEEVYKPQLQLNNSVLQHQYCLFPAPVELHQCPIPKPEEAASRLVTELVQPYLPSIRHISIALSKMWLDT